jgi:hypothetical protein
MAKGFTFVVYDPPKPGLPFLAVMIMPNGEVIAVPFNTAAEAEHHNAVRAAQAAQKLAEIK